MSVSSRSGRKTIAHLPSASEHIGCCNCHILNGRFSICTCHRVRIQWGNLAGAALEVRRITQDIVHRAMRQQRADLPQISGHHGDIVQIILRNRTGKQCRSTLLELQSGHAQVIPPREQGERPSTGAEVEYTAKRRGRANEDSKTESCPNLKNASSCKSRRPFGNNSVDAKTAPPVWFLNCTKI